jgi:ribA/ribD-fused uncharacterized protein
LYDVSRKIGHPGRQPHSLLRARPGDVWLPLALSPSLDPPGRRNLATVEHYYQAQKSLDSAYRQAIREAVTPGRAKRLAAPPDAPRRVSAQSWFRKNGILPRPDWHEVKLETMRRGDLAKFTQHLDLAALLLATGDAELIEDSPSEPFWGIGPEGHGSNWAGRVLMEVREKLRAALSLTNPAAEP